MFCWYHFFGRSGEIANQYLRKGSKILVEGRLVLEQWVDQSGQKRSKHSVTVESMQMLDSKGKNSGMAPQQGGGYNSNYNQQPQPYNGGGNGAYNQPPQQQNNYQQNQKTY